MTVTVGWLISTACLLSLVYGLYEVDLSPAAGAAYSSLSHSAWALGLGWIVVACSTGYGGNCLGKIKKFVSKLLFLRLCKHGPFFYSFIPIQQSDLLCVFAASDYNKGDDDDNG